MKNHRTIKEGSITWHLNPFKSKTARNSEHIVAVFDNAGTVARYLETASPVSAVREARLAKTEMIKGYYDRGENFYGLKTYQTALREVITGDPKTARTARDLIAKLSAATVTTMRRRRVASVVGSRVCVPAYLAGAPNPMRRIIQRKSEHAPLSIVVTGTSTWDISSVDLVARGVAIAAMVQKTSQTRPVNLYMAHGQHLTESSMKTPTTISLVKFPTSPIDLTRLAHLLSDQGFNRGLGFSIQAQMIGDYLRLTGDVERKGTVDFGSGPWPFNGNQDYIDARGGRDSLEKDLCEMLGTEIFYISGAKAHSQDFIDCKTDPVAWVNAKATQYTMI